MRVLISIEGGQGDDKTRLANDMQTGLEDSGDWHVQKLEVFELTGENRELHAYEITPITDVN